MSPKRDLPKTRKDAERMVRDGVAALAAIEEAESWQTLVMATEPGNRKMVRFDGTFQPGGRTYSFVAIRADHYRGERRWFISQNFAIGRVPTIPSPATWVEVVAFAMPGTIRLLSTVGNPIPTPNVPTGDAPLRYGSIDGHDLFADLFYNDRSGD